MDKVWFVWKHYPEFGDPDFVGFFHYRRFLSIVIRQPIVDIPASKFDRKLCIMPNDLLFLMAKHSCIGASMLPLQLTRKVDGNNAFIWNQMVDVEPSLKDPMLCKQLFDIFLDNAPSHLKQCIQQSFAVDKQYLCNIFVLQKEYFNELCSMLFQSLMQFADIAGDFFKKNHHPRWLGYFSERLVSCYLHAIQAYGCKILHLPLLTVGCSKHNKVVRDKDGMLKEVL